MREDVGARALVSGTGDDCFAFDPRDGRAALRWSWTSARPEGAVIGKLPGTGACVSLRYAFGEGVDAVEVGSYRNETGGVVWTEVPKDKAEIGLRVCGMTCGDHCAAHGSCGSCGGDAQCGWCPASGRCLSRDAALDGCPDFANDASDDTVGECLDECHSAVSCATCANRPGCGWCRSSGTCHGANAAGEQLAGLTCAPGRARVF